MTMKLEKTILLFIFFSLITYSYAIDKKLITGSVANINSSSDTQSTSNPINHIKAASLQWLFIKTTPSNANIFIDSVFVHRGECSVQLKPGNYKYHVVAPLYHDVSGDFVVSETKVELNLTLAPAYGSISIDSHNILSSQILLDGKEVAQSIPCTLEKIASGVHQIQINREFCRPFIQNTLVQDRKMSIINCILEPNTTKFIVNSENQISKNSTEQKKGGIQKDQTKIEMVFVKGGAFEMGIEFEEYEYEAQMPASPRHRVKLNDFYIAKTELTQEQWISVMGTNPSKFKGANLPVVNVSWVDAQEFIQKLNQSTNMNYRLPTEAEWEYAASGGTGTLYSGTDLAEEVDDYAWTLLNANRMPQPVGTKKPNKFGLYDMSGNIWEWCNDWLSPYSAENEINPTGPTTGTRRVHRGGCCNSPISLSSTKRRGGYEQNSQNSRIGFRLAMSCSK